METKEILDKIESACAGGVSAIRAVTKLTPIANGDKIFPPTYAGEGENAPPRYHDETRLVDGEKINVVVLDSIQSQANRLEQVLLSALDAGECRLPLLFVEIPNHGRITALDAPHRVHDAIFRDSEYKEDNEERKPFQKSSIGQEIVKASISDATALFKYCPTALIFGSWNSHGGGGVRSTKIQRALTSEIVGINAVPGNRSASRIDPLGIEKADITVYEHDGDMWTLDEVLAKRDKNNNPIKFGEKGKPSEIGHGNVKPTVSTQGGVTVAGATQTVILSFVQLRRLRFPGEKHSQDPEGQNASKGAGSLNVSAENPERHIAARAVLATLALYAVALQMEEGYDLRSRCQLIPVEQPQFEFVGPIASDEQPFTLDRVIAKQLFQDACKKAEAAGLRWREGLIELLPSSKLLELIHRSDGIN